MTPPVPAFLPALPADRGVADLVAEQAAATPDALAVVDGALRRSYRELAADVDALAGRMAGLGVRPEVHVGALLPRSYSLVVTLLATLRAGGVYVPLNPDLPPARLRALVGDVRPVLVVSAKPQADLAAQLRVRDTAVWYLEDGVSRPETPSTAAPGTLIGRHMPMAAAYVIQTSGSSGKPKSVQVEMRSLVNLLSWYRRTGGIGPGERVGQIVASSFDASIKNYLAPLVSGATLALFEDVPYDPRLMLDFLAREQVSVLNPGVPSVVYPMVELAAADGFAALRHLRCLALGGEAPDLARLRPWLDSAACQARVINIYGPTECADIASYAELASGSRNLH